MMDIHASLAAQGYGQAKRAAVPSPGAGEALAKAAHSFADVLAQGEQTARAAMTGNADPHALVQALAATESAVNTVVTVRDKVVEAYQEILRMPV
jgi:flagellar hook-basal body complex protein FliE